MYKRQAVGDAFNVNDELNITGTTMTIDADEDAVKVDNDEDTSVGTMYLSDNTMTISAGDEMCIRDSHIRHHDVF